MRPDDTDDAFEAQRPRLLRLAYRMLGGHAAAEDVVQEAWIRWSRAERETVRDPAAFLSRTVARLCLDEMKSARARRETYVGAWLPEPLLDEDADDGVDPEGHEKHQRRIESREREGARGCQKNGK